ncbi:unnamed protein product [Arabidopsis thaliana]|uniref:(thale cress) hypothetical protein n=1 Tax=Arabidopsis thaliana TaxID=3702 RepID=A0A7G2ECZ5_ARATH|nr:unnamed protein product [Arabidopsis thaliana]
MANPLLYSPINPQFFQPLLPGFTNHLDIPVAFFLKYLVGTNVGKTAELRSDASEMTWKVKIDGRRLSNGWEDFTIAHDLRVGDIVVFRQEGELVFHVTALGPSCCEIQYGEDTLEEDKIENVSSKKKSLKREAESAPDNSLDSCFVATVTGSNLKRDTLYIPKEFALSNGLMNKYQIVLMNEEGESWKIDLRREAYNYGRFYMRRGWRSFCIANGKKPGDVFAFRLVKNEETPVIQLFPMTIEDLDKLQSLPRHKIRKTEAAPSSPDLSSFVATVTASNLSRDRLYLPKTFIMSNGLLKKFQMCLMNEEGESWTIDVKHEAHTGRFLTIRGWRRFCVANGKKPGDLLKFKLVHNEETPVLQLLPLKSEDLHKLDPSNDTRHGQSLEVTKKEFLGTEATENEFLGAEVYRNDSFKASEKDTLPFAEPINEDNLPFEFMKGNGIKKAGKITMVDRYDAKWRTSLLMDKIGAMSLGRGSKGFCEVNGVEMNESFVLELIWEDTVPLLNACDIRDKPMPSNNDINKIDQLERVKNVRKNSSQSEAGSSSSDNSSFVALVKASNLKEDALYLPQDCTSSNGLNKKCRKIFLTDGGDRSWEMDLKFDKNLDSFCITRGWRHFCDENGKKVGSFFVFELTIKEETPLLYFPPSQSIIKYKKLPNQERFVTVRLVPDCLRNKRLYLSRRFLKNNGLGEPKMVTLVGTDGTRILANLLRESTGRMSLGRGWVDFAKANRLKIGEYFTLESIWENDSPILSLYGTNTSKSDKRKRRENFPVACEKEYVSTEARNRNEPEKDKNTEEMINQASLSENRLVITLVPEDVEAGMLRLPSHFMKANGIDKDVVGDTFVNLMA